MRGFPRRVALTLTVGLLAATGVLVAVTLPATASTAECEDVTASTNPLSGLSKLLGNGATTSPECSPAEPAEGTAEEVFKQTSEPDVAEPEVGASVATIDLAMSTNAQPAAQAGETVQDFAFLETDIPDVPPITGTVTFSLYLDDVGTCEGDPIYVSPPRPVKNGDPGEASASTGPVPTSTSWQYGTYYWKAAYSGDENYKPVVHECGEPNEQTTLYEPNTELMMLTKSNHEAHVGLPTWADAYFDKPGGSQDPPVTGTVTWKLYGPDGSDDCTGPVIHTVVSQVGLNEESPSGNYIPEEPGFHRWKVSYSGDENYDPIVHGCFEPGANAFFTAVGDPTDGDDDDDDGRPGGDADDAGDDDGDDDDGDDDDGDDDDGDDDDGDDDDGDDDGDDSSLPDTGARSGLLLMLATGVGLVSAGLTLHRASRLGLRPR